MVDMKVTISASELMFYSDASANPRLGFGAIYESRWIFAQWEPGYIDKFKPSIEYLELLGLTAAVLTWGDLLRNQRILVFCDNTAVVNMVNNMSSTCKDCMFLLCTLALNNLINNRRVFAKNIQTSDNYLADSLSRLQFKRFWRLAPKNVNPHPSVISPLVWPASHIWIP